MQSRVFFFSLRLVTVAALSFALSFPLPAQAPAGPQGTPPPPQSPVLPAAPKQEPSVQQKPQDAGQTIAVEVPVVTLDVIATTQHGDLLTGLKKENFRVLEDGQPQVITNAGPSDAPFSRLILMNSVLSTMVGSLIRLNTGPTPSSPISNPRTGSLWSPLI